MHAQCNIGSRLLVYNLQDGIILCFSIYDKTEYYHIQKLLVEKQIIPLYINLIRWLKNRCF